MEQQEPIQLPDPDWEAMPTEELLERHGRILGQAYSKMKEMNETTKPGDDARAKMNDFILKCYANANKIKAILLTRLIP